MPSGIIDNVKCYDELLFPVIAGTYYNVQDLYITLNISNKGVGAAINYYVETEFGTCTITVVFVPTIEIATNMYKYRNAILRFNPRSYLDLSRNQVNREIASTIRNKKQNEFALFNNGITMLSDATDFTTNMAQKDKAQLILANPQIINGGQTAYTLSYIYGDEMNSADPEKHFHDKEVMLKVITFSKVAQSEEEKANRLKLIEQISRATNQQTAVTEADRKSNDSAQIMIQEHLFKEYSRYYERKRGEFWNGLQEEYIEENQLIDRETFLRICVACELKPSQSRRSSENVLFKNNEYYNLLRNLDNLPKYCFGYMCYEILDDIQETYRNQKKNPYGEIQYGQALRYGKYAVVSVAIKEYSIEINTENILGKAKEAVTKTLGKWKEFETYFAQQVACPPKRSPVVMLDWN